MREVLSVARQHGERVDLYMGHGLAYSGEVTEVWEDAVTLLQSNEVAVTINLLQIVSIMSAA